MKEKRKEALFNCFLRNFFIILVFLSFTNGQSSVALTLSSLTVNSQATLTFSINTGSAIKTTDCIKFSVSSNYGSTASTYYVPFSGSTCTITSGQDASCSVTSSTTLQMNFNTASTNQVLTGSISFFRNPYSKVQVIINTGYYNNCGFAPNNAKTTQFDQFSSGTISTLNLASSSTTIGQENCILTLQFTPGSVMKPQGKIDFIVPFWYNTNQVQSNLFYMLDKIAAVSSGTSGITVSGGNLAPSTGTYSFTYQVDAGTDIAAGTPLTFRFTTFRNPISNQAVSGFSLFTLDIDGNIVDQTISSISFNGATDPATLTTTTNSVRIYLDSTTTVSNEVGKTGRNLYLSFIVNVPLEQGCFIQITFPDQIKIDIDEQMLAYQATGFMATTSLSQTSLTSTSVIKKSFGNGNYILFPSCYDSSQLGKRQQDGTIIFARIVSPTEINTIESFSVKVAKDQAMSTLIASGEITPAISLTSGSVALNSFTAVTTDQVQSSSTYYVSFTPSSGLFSTSYIELALPSNLEFGTVTSCTLSNHVNINNGATCTYSSQTLTINGAFSNSSLYGWDFGSSTIEFNLNIVGVNNPYSVKSAGSWGIKTYNIISSSNRLVDSGTSSTSFTSTISALTPTTTTIAVSNAQTYSTGSTYTFIFTLSKRLDANSKLSLDYPSNDVGKVSSTSCILSVSSVNTTLSSCSFSGTTLVMTNTVNIAAGSTVVLYTQGFRNPRSFKPTSSFTITTTDSSGNKIETGTGFQATMNIQSSINSLSVTPTNKTNGGNGLYSLALSSTVPFSDGDVVQVSFPIETRFNASGGQVCKMKSSGSTITCSISSNILTSTIKLSSDATSVEYTVTNIINPPNYRESSVFSSINHYLLDSNIQYPIQQLSTTTAKIKNTSPANILTYQLDQNVTDPNVPATYTIKFTPTNALSSSGSIKINWPSQVTVDAVTLQVTVTTNKAYTSVHTVNTQTREILLKSIFPGTYSSEVKVEMKPIINPKSVAKLNGFIINTYDDASQVFNTDFLADNILIPGMLCNDPCATCSRSNKTDCFTCWNDTGFPYLMKNSGFGTCLSRCPRGYTSNGNTPIKECIACDASCKACVDNGKVEDMYRCSECSSGYDLRTTDGRCLKSCSNGFFQSSSTTCGQCSSLCKNCNGSATSCTECNLTSGFPYLFEGICINNCPIGYTIVGSQCLKCSFPCLTCTGTSDTCTLCYASSGLNYLYSGKCYSNCPDGTSMTSVDISVQIPGLNITELQINTKEKSISSTVNMCQGCLSGCQICDSQSQGTCILCSNGLYLFEGKCLASCPKGYQVNFRKTECESLQNFPLIPFPFLIIALILLGVVLGGYLKDRKSLIITNLIALWGPVEFVSYLTLFGLSFIFSNYEYATIAVGAIGVYLILNVAFTLYLHFSFAKKDADFRQWITSHPKTSKLILVLAGLLSFKILKLHYSFFFGNDLFKVPLARSELYQKVMIIFTVIHIVLSNGLIIAFDLSGLIFEYVWGTQFYIEMIETLILSIGLIILEIIEMVRLKRYLREQLNYQQVQSDSVMNVSEMSDQGLDRKLREDMLKTIMSKVKGNQDIFLNNKLDDLFSKFGNRRCNSWGFFENEKELDPRMTKSLPISPNADANINFDRTPMLDDNVYADSQPPNPLGNQGKVYSDVDTQVNSGDIGKILARKGGDFVNFEGTESSRRKDKKNKKRGRKNQYYTQIDAEDDEEIENNDFGEDNEDLDVIKEEDEQEEMRQKLEKKRLKEEEDLKLQREVDEKKRKEQEQLEEKINQEREKQELIEKQQREEQEKQLKLEEERLIKEQEDELERKKKAQQEQELRQQQELFEAKDAGMGEGSSLPVQPIPEEISNDQQSETGLNQNVLIEDSLNDFNKMVQNQKEDEIQVPPNAEKRNFNENDILGDFDRDEKGNVIVLQDENGNYVDKQGRRVNEKGYLIQPETGDIVENMNQQKMFDHKDMDERGEVPAPFCVEKYNFNPFNIRGNFDYDKQGKPIILLNKQKELVDKSGRRVNKQGWLIDRNGNICDQFGRKKFDKKQMLNDGNEFPKLFNYNGRRFDILDVCGQFDRDPQTNSIIIRMDKNGQNIDNLGRPVNEKGYLIDQNGNIINKDGKKIFDKKHLKEGEIPKILPFTKFKVKNITGNFEMDPLGNPILDRTPSGQLVDRDGKLVNARGYLINQDGNVIDKYGKIMFDKEILDEEGEIPKVFRTGLLKSDSGSSLSRLMSEIEKNQPFEDGDHQRIQNELMKYKQAAQKNALGPEGETVRRDSAGTSMDSMMGDTPSNYNIANQRFEQQQKLRNNALNKKNQQQILEEEDSQYGDETDPQMRKRRLRRKKKKALAYRDPSDKDIKMAKAYGGIARGPVLRQPPKSSNRLMTAESQGGISQSKNLHKLAGSISGYQRDLHQNSSMSRDRFDGRDQFNAAVNQTNQSFLEGTNEPSIMAVPEHHIREQRLKQKKMNELKHKNKLAQKKKAAGGAGGGIGGDPDFEKMFGKDIDEFLEDSDWDIESFGKMSNFSKGTSRSAWGDGRIRGLESIYLQRIETSLKKAPKGASKAKISKPNFRVMQDRFIDEQDFLQESGAKQDLSSEMSQSQIRNNNNNSKTNRNAKLVDSANTTAMAQQRNDANIFTRNKQPINQTQYRPGNDFKTNRFDL